MRGHAVHKTEPALYGVWGPFVDNCMNVFLKKQTKIIRRTFQGFGPWSHGWNLRPVVWIWLLSARNKNVCATCPKDHVQGRGMRKNMADATWVE